MKKEDLHKQNLEDAKDLHQYGYAQQLLRDMGGFANFAVSFTIISTVTGAVMLFGHGLNYGGPLINSVGWPIVTLFTLAVVASLAEIASAIPTAGAMYHWAALLGGPGWGWFTAWFNFIGQIATTAGVDFGIALFAANLLGVSGPGAHLALYALVLASHAMLNHYGIHMIAVLNDISVWYHIGLAVFISAAFYFFAPRQPLSFAFTGYTTSSYPLAGAFLVGLLQAQWIMTGYDASAHITEETHDPRRNAPWGMFLAVLVSGLSAYPMLLAVTLAIGDLKAAAAAEYPFIYIAEHALGPGLGRGLIWAILLVMWFCGLSSMTANARMVFAFARDKGLPGSARLAKISPKYRTPASAVWLSAGVAFLLAVYSAAFTVIVSLATIGLYISYVIPIILVLRARRRGQWKELGPWNLGKWGGLINTIAVAWVAFITVLFVVPPNALTGKTFAGLLTVLAVYYVTRVRGVFQGPKKLGTEEELLRMEEELKATSVYHEA